MREKANSCNQLLLLSSSGSGQDGVGGGEEEEENGDEDDFGGAEDYGGAEGGRDDAEEGSVHEGAQQKTILAKSISESPQVIWPFLLYRATS